MHIFKTRTEWGYILCLTLYFLNIHTNKSCGSLVIHYIFQAMLLFCFVFKVSQQTVKFNIFMKYMKTRQHLKLFPCQTQRYFCSCSVCTTSKIYMLKLIHSQRIHPQCIDRVLYAKNKNKTKKLDTIPETFFKSHKFLKQ